MMNHTIPEIITSSTSNGKVEKVHTATTRAPRTSRACDYCKQKKLKCDGELPCSRCQKVANQCNYTRVDRPEPSRPRQRQSRKGAIQTLDNRIGKLEDLLSTLVNRISEKKGNPSIINKFEGNETSGNETTPERQPVEGMITDHDITDPDTDVESTSTIHGNSNDSHKIDSLTKGPCGEYIGTQSTLAIFSAAGLTWVSRKAKDPNTIKPILNILKEMDLVVGKERDVLTSFMREEDLVPLPSREECYDLLNHYDKPTTYALYVISRDEMRKIVDHYFAHKYGIGRVRKLTPAEMLCMYLLATCGSSHKVEKAALQDLDEDVIKYQRLENQYLSASFFYYQKISIFGEGVPGLKAILFLTCYCEQTITPELDYLLVSAAVRFAQSLGLHRKESLIGLSEEEVTTRRRLWFLCYMLDRDLCLKSGKPPMIHDDDISSINTDGLRIYLDGMKRETCSRMGISLEELDLNDMRHCDEMYLTMNYCSDTERVTIIEHSWLELAKITSKAYTTLFSANAFNGKTKTDILNLIADLNADLENFLNLSPISIRPGNPINIPKTFKTYNSDYVKIVRTHLSYYLIVMVVNRMALRKHWHYDHAKENHGVTLEYASEGDDRNRETILENKFSKLCLGACHEIVKLCNSFAKSKFSLWINSAFTLFSAYVTGLTYSMENPQSFETREIIEEMLRTSLDICQSNFPLNRIDIINYIKVNGMTFALGIFTKISLKVFNDYNPENPIRCAMGELDQRIISVSNILTRCIEDYKNQQPMNSLNKMESLLSCSSIKDIIAKFNQSPSSTASTPSTMSSVMTNNSLNGLGSSYPTSTTIPATNIPKMPKSGPHFPSYGRELLRPDYEKTLFGITMNSIASNSQRGINNNDSTNFIHQGNNGDINNLTPMHEQSLQTNSNSNNNNNIETARRIQQDQKPHSLDEILDTSDLQINWNYFQHNLFNIPVSFTDDINNVAPSQGSTGGPNI